METQLYTYTKYDAKFQPPFVVGITWTMDDGALAGSILVNEEVDTTPFDLEVATDGYTYLFKGVCFPNGAQKLQVEGFVAKEVVIS